MAEIPKRNALTILERRESRISERKSNRELKRLEKMNMYDETTKPKFVWFKGSVLRKCNSGFQEYWCDNGHWGVNSFYHMGDLITRRDSNFKNSVILTVATEAEWLKSVGKYAPTGYTLEDGSKWTLARHNLNEFNFYDQLNNDQTNNHFNYMYLLI